MTDRSDQKQTPDYGFFAIVFFVIVVAAWLLLTPFVPAIASSTLHRFHLQSESFSWWAIQQPIPAMYNFANRYEVREFPPGLVDPILVDPILDSSEKRYINHFPTRVLTFANTRYQYLNKGEHRWVTVDSTYRGQTLETRFHAQPLESGGFELLRLPPQGEAR